jgi:hypothetical protein
MGELLEEVNRSIRTLAAKVDPHNSSLWEFVCECGDEDCNERVGLSLDGYDELRDAEDALLAPGHSPTRPE